MKTVNIRKEKILDERKENIERILSGWFSVSDENGRKVFSDKYSTFSICVLTFSEESIAIVAEYDDGNDGDLFYLDELSDKEIAENIYWEAINPGEA